MPKATLMRPIYTAAETTHDADEAQLAADTHNAKQMEAVLHTAEINLNYTKVPCPVDGVVVSRNVDVGQTVAASFTTPTLFTIAQDLTKMQIDTNVDEADIGRVKVPQDVEFTVDAYPDRTFHGTVKQIRIAPIVVQNVVTYDVVITVDNTDLKLMPGMTANVSIVVASKEGVLKVPNTALRFKPTEKDGVSLQAAPAERAAGRLPGPSAGVGGGAVPPGDKTGRPPNRREKLWRLDTAKKSASAGPDHHRHQRRHVQRDHDRRSAGGPGGDRRILVQTPKDRRHRRQPVYPEVHQVMRLIEAREISKIYPLGEIELKALDSVSVTIEEGEFLAIMGPSGSGKSTFMNIVGCLDIPTAGSTSSKASMQAGSAGTSWPISGTGRSASSFRGSICWPGPRPSRTWSCPCSITASRQRRGSGRPLPR